MESSEVSSAQAPGNPRRRLHPCALLFAIWGCFLVCALIVAIVAGSPAWLLLAVPMLLYWYALGEAIARGFPETSLELATSLDRVLVDVGGVDAFRVVVQGDSSSPCRISRRRPATVVAALDFVRDADDGRLRGVAALQHAELRDPRLARRSGRWKVAQFVLVMAVAFGAASLAPADVRLLAALASIGLSSWLVGAAAAAWSRTRWAALAYEASDQLAARLAGNPAVVADALVAMRTWRAKYRASRSHLTRIINRCLQPITADWHESQGAQRLHKARDLPRK